MVLVPSNKKKRTVKKSIISIPEQSCTVPEDDFLKPKKFARTAALELTASCNHRCIFCCNVWKGQKAVKRPFERSELTTEEWKAVIDVLVDLGVDTVIITGGEPTLHKGFVEIVRHCVSKKLTVEVITNGEFVPSSPFLFLTLQFVILFCCHAFRTTVFDDDLLCKFLASNSVYVSLSIHGDHVRHAFATGLDKIDTLPRTLETMKHLSAAGVVVCANIVVGGGCDSAAQSMEAARQAVEEGGAQMLLPVRPIQTGAGVLSEDTPEDIRRFLQCSAEEFDVAFSELSRYATKKHIGISSGCSASDSSLVPDIEAITDSPKCTCGLKTIAIDPQGWLRPCTTAGTMGGNVFDPETGCVSSDTVLTAFHSDNLGKFRSKTSQYSPCLKTLLSEK